MTTTSVTSGQTSGGTVSSGDAEDVTSSGSTLDTGVFGSQYVYSGGATTSTIVSSGGGEAVSNGGFASYTTVSNGGLENVYSGGFTTATTVSSGGFEYVYSSGVASGTIVASGGNESVYSGGQVVGETIEDGGSANVQDGGTATGTFVSNGGVEAVFDSGMASGTSVFSGGTQEVFNSGVASGTSVFSGGAQEVYYGGVTSGTLVSSGGVQETEDGAATSGTVVQSGGIDEVYNSGVANGLVVSSGGIAFVYSGGTVSGETVQSGGHLYAFSGATVGLTSGVTFVSQGVVYASAGMTGLASSVSGLTVSGLGSQIDVVASGTATSSIIQSGAEAVIFSDGTASGTVVSNGGIEFVVGGTAAGTTVSSGGIEYVGNGGAGSGTVVSGGGIAYVYSGGLVNGATIAGSGLLDVESGAVAVGALTFSGTGGTLEIETAPSSGGGLLPGATVSGFSQGDTIDLAGISYNSTGSATLGAHNVLDVTEGGKTYTLQLDRGENYTGDTFLLAPDTTGDTDVTVTCFVTGTRIRAMRGACAMDVAVEALRIGDLAVTASGAVRPIRWIGQRTLRPAESVKPWNVHPVRIAAHAFGAGLPARELRLSPGHPVLVGSGANEHLVPVMCLINGTTIERVPVETVTYWHVELDKHDVLLAEGLPAESYLDWGDRGFFDEGTDPTLTNPDFVVPGLAARCRPVAIDGPVVEAERRRLDVLFATSLAAACGWPMPGELAVEVEV